ncbi:uncharacterized protein VTP21DRAFT_10258 [Calcarisporiella thermophila]|uniref:uncharacterized protein n=1 Tax=Calcarisporiella thermophila TaxID=911321 RepID=UPI003743DB18
MTVAADSPVFVAFIKRMDDKFYSQKDSLKCLNCDKTGKLGTNQDRLRRRYYQCTNCHKTIHRADMARRLGISVPPELVTRTREKYFAAGPKGNSTSEQPSVQQRLLRPSSASTPVLQTLSSRETAIHHAIRLRESATRESCESIEDEQIHENNGDETAQPTVPVSSLPGVEPTMELRTQVAALASKVEELEKRLQDQAHQHARELEERNLQHEKEFEERNLQHEKELEERDLQYAKELEERGLRYLELIKEKSFEREKELEERYMGEFEELIQEHQRELEEQSVKYVKQIAELKKSAEKGTPAAQASSRRTLNDSSPDHQPIRANPPKKPTASKPSYADIVKRLKIPEEDEKSFSTSLKVLHQNLRPEDASMSEVDRRHNLRRIYVTGLPFMRLGSLRKHLYNLRVRLSNVYNLAYIGRHTVEFLVAESYYSSLARRFSALHLRVALNYDPERAQDPNATDEVVAKVKAAFLKRLARTSERSPSHIVREYFSTWTKAIQDATAEAPPVSAIISQPVSASNAELGASQNGPAAAIPQATTATSSHTPQPEDPPMEEVISIPDIQSSQ